MLDDTLQDLARQRADNTRAKPRSKVGGIDPVRHEIASENANTELDSQRNLSPDEIVNMPDTKYRKRVKAELAVGAQADSATANRKALNEFYKRMKGGK